MRAEYFAAFNNKVFEESGIFRSLFSGSPRQGDNLVKIFNPESADFGRPLIGRTMAAAGGRGGGGNLRAFLWGVVGSG